MPAQTMPQPIELYYWPTPNGWKITIALEEMGLPYVIRPINISTGQQFEPAFLAIAPNNRMPAITDPQGPDATRAMIRFFSEHQRTPTAGRAERLSDSPNPTDPPH